MITYVVIVANTIMRPFGTVLGAALSSLPHSQPRACEVLCGEGNIGRLVLVGTGTSFVSQRGEARITFMRLT